ncbi:hypothetical protein FE633_17375 [Streptomyces montanus]|uniref:Uncharacterized protein n=1 Tax=Streptomyces montanus TaxID=2580423 RepID=A0A5R9FLX7_9ACTN|nr:hypothetical protein [Streptomyces montanus]TLS44917.1 hypothetical protein FE633_17375 [Streptomyces montanus]
MPQTITAASVAAYIRTAVTECARAYRQARTEAASTLSNFDESAEWEVNLGAIIASETHWAVWGRIPQIVRDSDAAPWRQNPDLSGVSDEQILQAARTVRAEVLDRLTTAEDHVATPIGSVWQQAHRTAALRAYDSLRLIDHIQER